MGVDDLGVPEMSTTCYNYNSNNEVAHKKCLESREIIVEKRVAQLWERVLIIQCPDASSSLSKKTKTKNKKRAVFIKLILVHTR